jgi:hypothetical protein
MNRSYNVYSHSRFRVNISLIFIYNKKIDREKMVEKKVKKTLTRQIELL